MREGDSDSDHRVPTETGAWYRHAVDQTAIVAMTDRLGTITYVNDTFCMISKYDRSELLGQNHRILNSGYHAKSFFVDMYRVIATGRTWRGEICNRAKDGSRYWVDTTIVPKTGGDGAIEGYVTIRYDITFRKQRELNLEREARTILAASRAQSDFLAGISHEIRTPLNAILGYTEVLESDSSDERKRAEYLETIRRNGNQLLSVVNDVLDISKIETGRLAIEPSGVSPLRLIAEAVSQTAPAAGEKGLEIETSIETEIPERIRTDSVRFRQVLQNLLENAVKFTEEGEIRVVAGLEPGSLGGTLRIEIADTGVGMSQEEISLLFQPYHDSDTPMMRRFIGSGLGLAIARRLIDLLGGELSVTSRPGEGCSFVVRVPVAEEECERCHGVAEATAELERISATPARWVPDNASPHPGLRGMRVLVVEDGPDNQRLIAHFLSRAGIEPVLVDHGGRAVDRITQEDGFNAILMDIRMPVMDGHEATRLIRSLGYMKPIIALTAHALTEEREEALASGCNDFETKPITSERLLGTLARWCLPGRAGGKRRAA